MKQYKSIKDRTFIAIRRKTKDQLKKNAIRRKISFIDYMDHLVEVDKKVIHTPPCK
jgi:hypothetical protein